MSSSWYLVVVAKQQALVRRPYREAQVEAGGSLLFISSRPKVLVPSLMG
jgi:hypothetical protein